MKIYILEGYVWTPERFRISSGIYRSAGGYRNPPGVYGPYWALVAKRRGRERWRMRPPSPIRIGWGAGRPHGAPPRGGILLLLGVGFPPFLVQLGGGRKGRGRERKGGPPPFPIRIVIGGRAPPLGRLLLSSTKAHVGPLTPRGVPVTPQYSSFI